MDFFYIVVALVIISFGSIFLAGFLLLLKDNYLDRISTCLTYLAGGILLGAVFFGMIPKGIKMIQPSVFFPGILVGILFFFILEKVVLWRTCKDKECERHIHAAVPIILIGDAFHNAIDGLVITASFLSSYELGIFVTLSVVLHEIPQELGDFGIFLKAGLSRRKALVFNLFSGSTAIVAGIATYYFMGSAKSLVPYALAFSASSFLYIALAELIPVMHRETKAKESFLQVLLIGTGIMVMYLAVHIH